MSKQIVINRCYGGFGLSSKAIERYAELAGITLFHYTQARYSWEVDGELFVKIKTSQPNQAKTLFEFWFTKDFGESFSKFTTEHNTTHWYYRDIERDDPLLVQVVRELGKEANTRFSKLEIVEIPEDVNWEISEYDGMESIHEYHRVWS